MKKRLFTLLMIAAMLAGMTTLIASADDEQWWPDPIDLGSDYTWVDNEMQSGWREVNNAAEEYDGDAEITLTARDIVTATHLVLEFTNAPEGVMQLTWQSDYDSWGWNQTDIPADHVAAMMSGNTMTIPFAYYIAKYHDFASIGLNPEDNKVLPAEEIAYQLKFLIAYYDPDLSALGLKSAQLTYEPYGAPPVSSITVDLTRGDEVFSKWAGMPEQQGGWTSFPPFDGDTGITLPWEVMRTARGFTIEASDLPYGEGSNFEIVIQSPAAGWAWDSAQNVPFTATEKDGGGYYVDFELGQAGCETLGEWRKEERGKIYFCYYGGTEDGEDGVLADLGITAAYLFWETPIRGEVEPEPEPEPEPAPEPEPVPEPTAPAPAPAETAPVPADESSDGAGALVWILIAGGAVVIIVVIIVIVTKGKK